jgi:uncharacterized SAM-binding protein YcdF (DUF218 family)
VFFFLSKLLDIFLSPLTWSMLAVAVVFALVARRSERKRLQLGLMAGAVLNLYVFSLANVSNRLERSLEDLPSTMQEGVVYDAVVLMGGVVEVYAEQPEGRRSFNNNVERMLATYDVLRSGQANVAIISGGHTDQGRLEARESPIIAAQLVDWGIEPSRIIVDALARNTHENAVNVTKIVREHGWQKVLIVTSAFHMRRSVECFTAEGLSVDTLVVDRRSADPATLPIQWLPRADALAESTDAMREWFGRWVYRARGYAR